MIRKVSTNEYLNLNDLFQNQKFSKICLVKDVKSGVSILGQGYYTFYVRDCNAHVLTARLFNPDGFSDSGFNALLLKGKPAKIDFTATIYNGNWSLVLEKISLYNGDFDYDVWLGDASVKFKLPDEIEKVIAEGHVPFDFYNVSVLNGINNGKKGSAARLYLNVLKRLLEFRDTFQTNGLIDVFNASFDFWFRYQQLKDKFEIIDAKSSFALKNDIFKRYERSVYITSIMETCLALIKEGEPKHLFCHIICDLMNTEIGIMNLVSVYESIPSGMFSRVDDKILMKY